ncbi:zinc finger, C3HC4 type [Dictyocaulus viviparus]|uniref:Zinc finger, C3HC4 type n=1 Tax=Dictyocaulus viviparus TaxID=29172 RepID=A0A0D8X7Q5_DICVI|nr:zinc finger, C3HC4 type [Dictyocaulus viviparus]
MGNLPSSKCRTTPNFVTTQRQYEEVTWASFIEMIKELNKKCSRVRNEKGNYICFALDKTCQDGVFWKNKAKIKCFYINLESLVVSSNKTLHLREFLNVYNLQKDATQNQMSSDMCSSRYILDETADSDGLCCICMENNNEVLLPCLHSFCMVCVAQEMEFRPQFCCPVCKTRIEHPLKNSWEVADPPQPSEVITYLSKLCKN